MSDEEMDAQAAPPVSVPEHFYDPPAVVAEKPYAVNVVQAPQLTPGGLPMDIVELEFKAPKAGCGYVLFMDKLRFCCERGKHELVIAKLGLG